MLITILIFVVALFVFLFTLNEIDWRKREAKLRKELEEVRRANAELNKKSQYLLDSFKKQSK